MVGHQVVQVMLIKMVVEITTRISMMTMMAYRMLRMDAHPPSDGLVRRKTIVIVMDAMM